VGIITLEVMALLCYKLLLLSNVTSITPGPLHDSVRYLLICYQTEHVNALCLSGTISFFKKKLQTISKSQIHVDFLITDSV